MEEITFELETVTPLFIAGADQRNIENEGLRAPSLRGLLRWWFRAIMGGITSVNNLKILESKIFGSTNQKSYLKVFSTTEDQPSEISIPSKLRYPWFSIYMQKRKNQKEQCYPPRTKFKVILRSYNENSLKIALGCLWTIIYLGGIGARMRRGAGSLKVNSVSDKTPYGFIFSGNSIGNAKEFLERNLAEIFEDFKEFAGEKFEPQRSPGFAVLSHAKISLVNTPSTRWEDILEKMSGSYQQFRRRKELKYRYTFGLPIIQCAELKNLRQASPLFIGVMDLNGSYTLRIVKFYTSIHYKFSQQLRFLKQDLDNFDVIVARNNELGEIEIKMPEVK